MPRVAATIVYNRLPDIARRLPNEVGKIVHTTLFGIETDIKQRMAGPKSGRVYGDHIASAPGEAPAIDTVALANSIQTEMDSQTSGATYTNIEYAEFLEYGTSRMAARPAWIPAAEAARSPFMNAMRDLESKLD